MENSEAKEPDQPSVDIDEEVFKLALDPEALLKFEEEVLKKDPTPENVGIGFAASHIRATARNKGENEPLKKYKQDYKKPLKEFMKGARAKVTSGKCTTTELLLVERDFRNTDRISNAIGRTAMKYPIPFKFKGKKHKIPYGNLYQPGLTPTAKALQAYARNKHEIGIDYREPNARAKVSAIVTYDLFGERFEGLLDLDLDRAAQVDKQGEASDAVKIRDAMRRRTWGYLKWANRQNEKKGPKATTISLPDGAKEKYELLEDFEKGRRHLKWQNTKENVAAGFEKFKEKATAVGAVRGEKAAQRKKWSAEVESSNEVYNDLFTSGLNPLKELASELQVKDRSPDPARLSAYWAATLNTHGPNSAEGEWLISLHPDVVKHVEPYLLERLPMISQGHGALADKQNLVDMTRLDRDKWCLLNKKSGDDVASNKELVENALKTLLGNRTKKEFAGLPWVAFEQHLAEEIFKKGIGGNAEARNNICKNRLMGLISDDIVAKINDFENPETFKYLKGAFVPKEAENPQATSVIK